MHLAYWLIPILVFGLPFYTYTQSVKRRDLLEKHELEKQIAKKEGLLDGLRQSAILLETSLGEDGAGVIERHIARDEEALQTMQAEYSERYG